VHGAIALLVVGITRARSVSEPSPQERRGFSRTQNARVSRGGWHRCRGFITGLERAGYSEEIVAEHVRWLDEPAAAARTRKDRGTDRAHASSGCSSATAGYLVGERGLVEQTVHRCLHTACQFLTVQVAERGDLALDD
jgi:hypothetical protein